MKCYACSYVSFKPAEVDVGSNLFLFYVISAVVLFDSVILCNWAGKVKPFKMLSYAVK